MVMNTFLRGALCLAVISQAGFASAMVVLSNLPGNDGTQSAGLNNLRVKGMAFVVDGSGPYTINSVRLRLNTTTDDSPIIELHADSSNVPGALIGTFTNPTSFGNGIAEYDFTGSFAVDPNTKYWIVAKGPSSSAYDWKASSPAQTPTGIWTHGGSVFSTNGGSSWSSSSILTSYWIDATLVPEPATLIALGAGLAALASRRRRK